MTQPSDTIASRFGMKSRSVAVLPRSGNVLVVLAILMPVLFGIAGLVIDGGLMMDERRNLHHATDAAATAAAVDLRDGKSPAAAISTATRSIQDANAMPDAAVTVNIPPATGTFAGQPGHVEVIAQRNYQSRLVRAVDGILDRSMQSRSVAGVHRPTTAKVALVVLDPEPDSLTINIGEIVTQVENIVQGLLDESLSTTVLNQTLPDLGIGQLLNQVGLGNLLNSVLDALTTSLSDLSNNNELISEVEGLLTDVLGGLPLAPLPGLTAGMEVEGLGQLHVDGAIFVNNKWGGVDENGKVAGDAAGPPYGMACMPILPTTRVLAHDIRIAGGVDRPENYQPFSPDGSNPLQANWRPVPDPFENLPVPTTSVDSNNVHPEQRAGNRLDILSPGAVLEALKGDVFANVLSQLGLGLLQPVVQPLLQSVLNPAIEDALLQLLGAEADPLQPGVYDSIHVASIFGGVTFEPGIYIVRGDGPIPLLLVGDIQAEGVMFYLTNSTDYDGISGAPDNSDGESVPPKYLLPTLLPSAVIIPNLGSSISGLDDADSPFDGLLIYQRRHDRRLILLAAHHLLAGGEIAGTIYSKWGHVLFLGGLGSYDLSIVSGTLRVLTAFDTTIAPTIGLRIPPHDVLLLE